MNRNRTLRHGAAADPEVWRATNFFIDKNSGRQKMSLMGTPSNLHRNLKKAQSTIAMQIRSEYIEFNSYLYRRKVLGVETPRCSYEYPTENVKHAVIACLLRVEGRAETWKKAKNRSYEAMMNDPEDIERIT